MLSSYSPWGLTRQDGGRYPPEDTGGIFEGRINPLASADPVIVQLTAVRGVPRP